MINPNDGLLVIACTFLMPIIVWAGCTVGLFLADKWNKRRRGRQLMDQFLVQLTLCVIMCSECLYLSWIKKRLDRTLADIQKALRGVKYDA